MKRGPFLLLMFLLYSCCYKTVAAGAVCSTTYGTQINGQACMAAMDELLKRHSSSAQKFLMVPQVAIHENCKLSLSATGEPSTKAGGITSLSLVIDGVERLLKDCVLVHNGVGGSNDIGVLRITVERTKESETSSGAELKLRTTTKPACFWFRKGLNSEPSSAGAVVASYPAPYTRDTSRKAITKATRKAVDQPLELRPRPAKRLRSKRPSPDPPPMTPPTRPMKPYGSARLPNLSSQRSPLNEPPEQELLPILPLADPPLLGRPTRESPTNLPMPELPRLNPSLMGPHVIGLSGSPINSLWSLMQSPTTGLSGRPLNSFQGLTQHQVPALLPPNRLDSAASPAAPSESLFRSQPPGPSANSAFGSILPPLDHYRLPPLSTLLARPGPPTSALRPSGPVRIVIGSGPVFHRTPLGVAQSTVSDMQLMESMSLSDSGSEPSSQQGNPRRTYQRRNSIPVCLSTRKSRLVS